MFQTLDRVAIIDLVGRAQPRVDQATGDARGFNGEIYAYRALADELRAAAVALCDRSDTEVLFQLIRRDPAIQVAVVPGATDENL